MRFHFLRIEGEHLLNANWPLHTANGLQCHTALANWPLQTAIITDQAVYNAIQLVRRCASAINKKHATLCRKGHTKKGRVYDQANPTFLQKHKVDKYGG
jgi:ribosomal protein L40E